ncbi:hypothetical protein ACHAWX_000132 [Stephanocyclus meneghinianus]
MCQNNLPAQLNLLQAGHIPQLIQLFLNHLPTGKNGDISCADLKCAIIEYTPWLNIFFVRTSRQR